MAQLRKTIDIIENAIDELIDEFDGYASGNEELLNYALDDLENLKEKIINKKWYDSIGQSLD